MSKMWSRCCTLNLLVSALGICVCLSASLRLSVWIALRSKSSDVAYCWSCLHHDYAAFYLHLHARYLPSNHVRIRSCLCSKRHSNGCLDVTALYNKALNQRHYHILAPRHLICLALSWYCGKLVLSYMLFSCPG
ncbi:hypothetical protein KC19_VG260800 [Ceratodon purpureus]|uniref:Uncharacterized protein n=1 Tax=Ceratodon purpureus TaxID=3225 RepID=A0A8T0HUK2_CERPU|nr:hypothetical protein KC19_VG260800 [Ceratodon purpureus]